MLSTITDEAVEAAHKKLWPAPDATFIAPSRDDIRAALTAALPHISSPAPEAQQEPVAYRIHAPEDDYYGTGPDMLQFHPLAQHDIDNGYRQTPLYGRPALELSGNTGELIDKMAEAIRGDTVYDDTPWATLSEDRKIGWRGDAERALAVVKEYLTARRPSEQAVTEAMELARAVLAQSITAGHNVPGPTPEDIEKAFWALDAALKSAMEAGR